MTEPYMITLLRSYNKSYRNGHPEVDDAEYDKLYDEIKKKYPNDPFFSEVGMLGEGNGEEVPLEYLLGSLRKFNRENISTFLTKTNSLTGWVVSDKIDGLSVLVTWEDGKISHAELRGDGTIGTNCTDKVKLILHNQEVGYSRLVMRGEIVLSSTPEELKQMGLKNRRNGAVGIMKRDSMDNVDKLNLYFYELVDRMNGTIPVIPPSEYTRFSAIQEMGFKIPNVIHMVYTDPEQMATNLERWTEQIDKTNYDADGKVVCVNLSDRENSLLPDLKIAYKKKDELIETIVRKVGIQVSRLGRLVPVVYYDPIEIGGATCTKASAHNYQFMKDNEIGVGSKILICRSQEVIPYISAVVKSEGWELPISCPECGSMVEWDENSVHLVCSSLTCPAQSLKNITHYFVSLGLEEFSESSFAKLGVKDIFDVYNLTSENIMKIEGFGEKSAKDFVVRIQATKKTKPELLIKALGINLIGRTIGKIITTNFPWERVRDAKLTVSELIKLPNIGEKRAKVLIEKLTELSPILAKLESIGVTVESTTGPLLGKTFCVTGKLESMTRSQIENWIIDHGGEVAGIKKIANMYLVTNEASGSAKYKKATEYGIPVITEKQLYEMVN